MQPAAGAQPAIEDIYPLSPSQQGILLTCVANGAGGQSKFVETAAYDWCGALNQQAFRQAWRSVVQRHAALRTAFVWKNRTSPLQFVLRTVDCDIPMADWRGLSSIEQDERQREYIGNAAATGFALSKPPLMRLAVFQLDESRYRLVLVCHHILVDGWCMPLILGDLLSYYRMASNGGAAPLSEAPGYRTYIDWLQGQDWHGAEGFWRTYLRGFRRATALGIERTVAGAPSSVDVSPAASGFHDLYAELPAATTAALKEIARNRRITLNSLFQGVWALLLTRYSGSLDVVFGATVAGRPGHLRNAESIVGLFSTTIPVRVQVEPKAMFTPWAAEGQEKTSEAEAFSFCSAGQIHGWSELPGGSRLFESLLVFQNYSRGAALAGPQAGSPGVQLSPAGHSGAQTRYAITFLISPMDRIGIHAVHDRTRVGDAAAATMLAHWLRLLEAIASDPLRTAGSLMESIPSAEVPSIEAERPTPPDTGISSPLDDVERRVVEIWRELLGAGAVRPGYGFFECGGHSFLAMQLLVRYTEVFGRKFSLGDLLDHPTTGSMAAFLRSNPAAGSDGAGSSRAGECPSCLVALKWGQGPPALYLVHGADGQVLCYSALAGELETGQPIYGIQAPLEADGDPGGSVEGLAARYVGEIQRLQPEGPYRLAGWSFGGYVAYEMARILENSGQTVELFLLDTSHPSLLPRRWLNLDEHTQLFAWMRPNVNNQDDNAVDEILNDAGLDRFLELDRDAQYRTALEWSLANKLLPKTWRIGDLKRLIARGRKSQRAAVEYAPQPYRGGLVLVRVDSPAARTDTALGWRALVSGPVIVHEMAGTHQQMVVRPYVETLAGILKEELNRAGAGSDRW